MSRDFNTEVFSKIINGNGSTTPYYSAEEYNQLLGRSDALLVQGTVDSADAAIIVTIDFETSNDGVHWTSIKLFLLTIANSADVPKTAFQRIPANATLESLGAFGRFKVYADTGTAISVRIVVCGRSS